jgi:hypothetical protein
VFSNRLCLKSCFQIHLKFWSCQWMLALPEFACYVKVFKYLFIPLRAKRAGR